VPDPNAANGGFQPSGETPKFNPEARHQSRPRLRAVRGFGAQFQGKPAIGLADARQLSDKVVFTAPAFAQVLPLMDGQRSLDEIVSQVGKGLTVEMLQTLVAQLDDACLLEGPGFDALVAKIHADFDASDTLPPGSTATVAEALAQQELGEESTEEQRAEAAPGALARALDKFIAMSLEKAEDPALDELPKAIIAPHIDYFRGWMNYGAIYGRMRVVDRPDRIVILGTNHFGSGTGVVACDKGYETPLGVSPADQTLIAAVRRRLGEGAERLFKDRFDHEREHSIELQIPWIQHVFGKDDAGRQVPVFGALVHDPTVNSGHSYDGKGTGLDEFLDALEGALEEVGGRTLIISSADLSHVGPAFGDQQPVMGDAPEIKQFQQKVLGHDRELLSLVEQNKVDDLLTNMAWQQNPTRWCSVGNIVATMRLAKPGRVRILNYAAAADPQGQGMVSHCAAVMS
jgi:AmmeMemoRadiSam system protein B